MPQIHPTAVVDDAACIADDVKIGPGCVVEGDVEIGSGCVLQPYVIVRQYTHMGRNNFVDSFSVLGGLPQDLKFEPSTRSYVRIGDDNTFREGVTISRATGVEADTVIGNGVYMMANSHVGHEGRVHDGAVLVNGALVAGHAEVGPRSILSGNACLHQFCWMGEMVMVQGNSGLSGHVPPYVMVRKVNTVAGLNVVGLQRAEHITREDRRQIQEAFNITFRSGLPMNRIVERLDACTDWSEPAEKFRNFIHRICQAEGPYRRPMVAMLKK